MIFKCRGCGYALRFDEGLGKLICDYCGSQYDPSEFYEEEHEETLKHSMTSDVVVCKACGAKIMVNNVEASSFCAYCGQPTVLLERMRVRKPDTILPFKITKEEACNLIREKLNGKFIPDEVKNINLDCVHGIYVPYSFSDLNYQARQVIRGQIQTRNSTKIKYYYRQGNADFENLPVDRSKKFDDDSAMRLEPFPMEEFVPFEASYLSGFYADCGDEEDEALNLKINNKASRIYDSIIMDTVKAGSKVVYRENTHINITDTKISMIPVWFFAYSSGNETYTIMVNGATGKVVGAMPYDKKKTMALSLTIGIILSVILGTIGGFLASFSLTFDDGFEDFIKIALVAIITIFGTAAAKLKAFKKSRKLTADSAIYELAKERQEV